MKFTMTAVAALLASAAFTAIPANAQTAAAAAQPAAAQPKVSRGAAKPLQELQAAVNANNAAEVPAKVAAATAAATTADDRYMVGVLQYKYATTAKDDAARAAALETMIASGFKDAPAAELYADLGSTYTRMKQDARALEAYNHALQLNPASVDATAGLAEAKAAQGQTAEAIALLQKGIALQSAGGTKAPESWYKRAVAIAYKAKQPQAATLAREWVTAYPTTDAWTNALAIYQNVKQPDEATLLDLMRLKRAAGVLTQGDYFTLGDVAMRKGFSGESKAVLEEGFAANKINKSDPSFGQLYSVVSAKASGDRDGLAAAPAAGATAKQLLTTGDAYYGYADYAKAVQFYRAALGASGADANLVNLHLGMALARQGDKAGATAALAASGGAQAELAKYWLAYVNSKA